MGAALKPLLKRLAVGSPAALPTLDLGFLAQTYKVSDGAGGMSSVAFADLITFTRSSAAWRFNASGVLEQVAANQPRFDYDPVTLAPRGLLVEEQRTNLFLNSASVNLMTTNSGATVTVDAALAPDGTMTADQVNMTASAASGVYRTGVITSAAQHVLSVFLRFVSGADSIVRIGIEGTAYTTPGYLNVDLATGQVVSLSTGATAFVTHLGGSLYRVAVTQIPSQSGAHNVVIYSGTTNAKQIIAWGLQVEQGAFPTSYIPTTSTQVTRAADVAGVNTLSPWFNPDEGTLFVEGAPLSVAGPVKRAAAFTNGTQQNRIVLDLAANTGITEYLVTASGVSMASITSAAIGTAGTIRMAGVYGATDYRMAAKGALGTGTAPGGAVPAITKLELGALVGAQFFNGHIRRIRYWPRRLFDNELQGITA